MRVIRANEGQQGWGQLATSPHTRHCRRMHTSVWSLLRKGEYMHFLHIFTHFFPPVEGFAACVCLFALTAEQGLGLMGENIPLCWKVGVLEGWFPQGRPQRESLSMWGGDDAHIQGISAWHVGCLGSCPHSIVCACLTPRAWYPSPAASSLVLRPPSHCEKGQLHG